MLRGNAAESKLVMLQPPRILSSADTTTFRLQQTLAEASAMDLADVLPSLRCLCVRCLARQPCFSDRQVRSHPRCTGA